MKLLLLKTKHLTETNILAEFWLFETWDIKNVHIKTHMSVMGKYFSFKPVANF